jgi:hypothetical protein
VEDGRQTPGWKKSSRSDTTDCVEVLRLPDRVLVRDSKHPEGDVLAFGRDGWDGFLADIKDGIFDL